MFLKDVTLQATKTGGKVTVVTGEGGIMYGGRFGGLGLRMGNLIKTFGKVSDNGIEVGNLLLQMNKLVTGRRDGWRVSIRRRNGVVVGKGAGGPK